MKEPTVNLKLMQAFKLNLTRVKAWAPMQSNVKILYVSHNNLIQNPKAELEKINAFMGGKLDINAMASVVDKNLYREKV